MSPLQVREWVCEKAEASGFGIPQSLNISELTDILERGVLLLNATSRNFTLNSVTNLRHFNLLLL